MRRVVYAKDPQRVTARMPFQSPVQYDSLWQEQTIEYRE